MDTVAVQRRLADYPITLAHLLEQPFAAWTVDAGKAHQAGGQPAMQGQLLGLTHDPSGVAIGLSWRVFTHPPAELLAIHAAAGDKQQALGPLALLRQPIEDTA